jgi:hypothetical protein
MSDSLQVGSNEAPKTPAPGTSAPAPQQNQGDKPARSPVNSRSKLLVVGDLEGPAALLGFFIPGRKARGAFFQPGPMPRRPSLEERNDRDGRAFDQISVPEVRSRA